MRLMGLMLAGPRSRAVLAALTDHDVSTAAFRFMDHRAMDVAGVPAMVNRLSYTGDLGYEISGRALLPPHALPGDRRRRGSARLRDAGAAVDAAGEELADLVRRARPIYGAFEGGMERFVRLDKDFIGRDAAAREAEAGPRLRRVSLAIEAEDADVMGDEPIWARVDRDYGAVAPSHGYGAPRFDADGRARCRGPTRGATATGGWSAG